MWSLFWPAVACVFVILATLTLRAVLLAPLRRWVRSPVSVAFLDAVRLPSVLWSIVLGLQDTLSNLFAGVHLLADRPIRVGDYVKIGDGVEGFVLDVGWRSTRVRLLHNNIVIVPNRTVAQSVITNYDMPERRLAVVF